MRKSRRNLILAGLASTTVTASYILSRSDTEPAEETVSDLIVFRAIVDTIVPADQTPGALEVGIAEELLTESTSNAALQTYIQRLVSGCRELATNIYATPFESLDIDQRENILHEIKRNNNVPGNTIVAFITVRNQIINRFYLSNIGQQSIGYHPPYPVGYL